MLFREQLDKPLANTSRMRRISSGDRWKEILLDHRQQQLQQGSEKSQQKHRPCTGFPTAIIGIVLDNAKGINPNIFKPKHLAA